MKKFNSNLDVNPSFNSVTELTNTTFNPSNYVENRMATEQQISELYTRIVENEKRRDSCCRDIIVWEARVQIVRMNTNETNGLSTTSGGVVVSGFDENVAIGTMRRGLPYAVTFPLKWDSSLYFPVTPQRNSSVTNCNAINFDSTTTFRRAVDGFANVSYRYAEDQEWNYPGCTSTRNNRANFLGYSADASTSDGLTFINSQYNWGNFIKDIKNDGTVTIKDTRRNTNFNIIRFYTQWTLNRCADDSLLSDSIPSGISNWNQSHSEEQQLRLTP